MPGGYQGERKRRKNKGGRGVVAGKCTTPARGKGRGLANRAKSEGGAAAKSLIAIGGKVKTKNGTFSGQTPAKANGNTYETKANGRAQGEGTRRRQAWTLKKERDPQTQSRATGMVLVAERRGRRPRRKEYGRPGLQGHV